jgi:hypothetical protein
MWSHRLQSLPISWLAGVRFLHKAHFPIFITPGLPLWGNLSLRAGLGCPRDGEGANHGAKPQVALERTPFPNSRSGDAAAAPAGDWSESGSRPRAFPRPFGRFLVSFSKS